MHFAIITIEAVVPPEDLDPEDSDVVGTYGILMGNDPGMYSTTPRREMEEGDDPLREAALDVLHDRVCIGTLDDYEIKVSIDPENEPDEVRWL